MQSRAQRQMFWSGVKSPSSWKGKSNRKNSGPILNATSVTFPIFFLRETNPRDLLTYFLPYLSASALSSAINIRNQNIHFIASSCFFSKLISHLNTLQITPLPHRKRKESGHSLFPLTSHATLDHSTNSNISTPTNTYPISPSTYTYLNHDYRIIQADGGHAY